MGVILVKQQVDTLTGEILTESMTTHTSVKKENYILHYKNTIMDYKSKFTSINHYKVFDMLVELIVHDTGEVLLPPGKKQELLIETNLSMARFNAILKFFVEINILFGSRGFYYFNPRIMWIGDLKNRVLLIRRLGL